MRCFDITKAFNDLGEAKKKRTHLHPRPSSPRHSIEMATQLPTNANVVLKYGVPSVSGVNENENEDSADLVSHPSLASCRTHTLVLGSEMNDADDEQIISYLNSGAFVPNVDALQIIAHKDIWTPRREQHLPSVVAYVTRTITPTKGIQTTVVKCDFPEGTKSSVSIPIDQLFDDTVNDIVNLPGLDTLLLLPPLNAATFLAQVYVFQQQLLRALIKVKTLKKAVVPLDFFACTKDIIEALKEHQGLTSLELAMPTSFSLLALDSYSQILLEVGLLKTLEPFSQLEELVVGKDLLTISELFVEMGQRMFDTRIDSADGQTVCFKDPKRDLLYGRSALSFWGI
ncbi:hypothetical protein GALMADRAFT_724382 [Galerina marginata CBS 339.88]|uniref:Uncharacterized protein n=1 Tax=Galerina marginata (strain CBS 339.88) TaxID=685588 RepID=A0A067T2E0_GALM3|nr:hypothetical protein GALMADRAFT_724382 [Galerina marginata CBS 339.88]